MLKTLTVLFNFWYHPKGARDGGGELSIYLLLLLEGGLRK
jgi:hypothetical protein